MDRQLRNCSHMITILWMFTAAAHCQTGPAKSTTGPAPPSLGSISGILYPLGTASTEPPSGRDKQFVCYELVAGGSAAEPLSLLPTDFPKTNITCANGSAPSPLFADKTLVIAIQAMPNVITSVAFLNINVVAAAATPLNPAPMRPVQANTQAPAFHSHLAPLPSTYYFTWPVKLVGDTGLTLSVNAVYVGPAAGQAWQANTAYASGAVVTPSKSNGHYYVAENEGQSGSTEPPWVETPPTSDPSDQTLKWVDMGIGTPVGAGTIATPWSPDKEYGAGSIILDSMNGHYYEATSSGESGDEMPQFPATQRQTVAEPRPAGLKWQEQGTAASGTTPPPWSPMSAYMAGQSIKAANGHIFTAANSGISGSEYPLFSTTQGSTVVEPPPANLLTWEDLGTGTPAGLQSASPWQPIKYYATDSVILDPTSGHFYLAQKGGLSWQTPPTLPQTIPAPFPDGLSKVVSWQDIGTTAPIGSPAVVPAWTPNTVYMAGYVISDPASGHYYLAISSGESGAQRPQFNAAKTIKNGAVLFEDAGTVPPAALGTASATDQLVPLYNAPLPQVHPLYYFNLAAGMVYSDTRMNPTASFFPAPGSSSTANGTCATGYPQVGSSCIAYDAGVHTVEPVLMLTTYLWGIDAESKFSLKKYNVKWTGLSLGFSLASPSTSFYFGGSTEVLPDVQLVYGAHVARVSALAPLAVQNSAGTSPAPTLNTQTDTGYYIGFTFNVGGFIPGFTPW